jgi:hypothetical protein
MLYLSKDDDLVARCTDIGKEIAFRFRAAHKKLYHDLGDTKRALSDDEIRQLVDTMVSENLSRNISKTT